MSSSEAVRTVRTKAERAIEEAALDSMGTAVVACDRFGVVTLWNRAAHDHYGWTADEMIGLPFSSLIETPDDLRQIADAVLGGAVRSTRWRCKTKSGDRLLSEATASPLRDRTGNVLGMVVSLAPHSPEGVSGGPALDAPEVPPSELTVTYTPDGTITTLSSSLCRRLGVQAAEVVGQSIMNLFDPFDAAVVRSELVDAANPAKLGPFRMRLRGAEGAIVPFEGTRIDRSGDDSTSGLVWNFRDLGDLHLADKWLEESERRYRSIIETADEGIWIQDCDGIVTFANPKMAEMLGATVGSLIGTSLLTSVPDSDRLWVSTKLDRVASGLTDNFECGLVGSDGGLIDVLVSASPILNGGGEVTGVLQMVNDITDRKQVERENLRLVMEDGLTGLASRALVVERIKQILAHQERTPGLAAVLFMDLDNFKKINDSLGHGAGDRLLQQEAERILSVCRPEDTVGRFGGDEFEVVLDHLSSVEQATLVATRISEVLSKPVVLDGVEVMTTVSIGVATTPSTDPESIMRDADTAMYRAKERGGNCNQLFDQTLRVRALDRIDLERDLRRAIDNHEFKVHYQPVVTMDGGIVGFEALARWLHPTRGLVPPGDFIPIAESTGIIVELGAWILDQACRDLARWRSFPGGDRLTMAVNLSGRQLLEPDFPAQAAEVLANHGLEGGAICLEITESVLMDDAHAANTALAAIHGLGIRLAVDDFGTGYSSLLYLRRFPVDALKLDRFFVAGMDQSNEDLVIVHAVVDLAHSLNLEAIAEGIETEDQRLMLASMGCDLAQGFLWSPAVPVEEADHLVRAMRIDPPEPGAPTPEPAKAVVGHPESSAVPQADRMSVLLVDDSDGDRSLLTDQLQARGSYEVVGEAADGVTAVVLAKQLHPDIVLLDMSMPGMNGLETLPRLLADSPASRVVVLSGYLSQGLRELAMEAGATSIFEKGLGFDAIVEQLAQLVGQRGTAGDGEFRN
jgi:diguanylate cyclase (GGDEF)-like protein/PAS domain S-box-containing protein